MAHLDSSQTILWVAVAIIAVASGCTEPGQVEIARGNALASRNDMNGALQAYDAAAAAAPKRARPRELKGHVLFDQRRFDEAAKAYQEAIAIDPDSALEARIGLARVDAERGQITPAIEQLNAILAKHPNNLYARLSRANLAVRRSQPGDAEQAVADTTEAMAIDAKNTSVLYTRGNAFLAAGQLDKAEETFRILSNAHPGSPLAAYGEARLASARKNRSAVLDRLKDAKKKANVASGSWKPDEVREDSAFQWLRDDPEFLNLLNAS